METSEVLRHWLSAITKPKVVEALQEKLQPFFYSNFDCIKAKPLLLSQVIKKYTGPTDCEGRPDGFGVVEFEDGTVFRGTLVQGSREGKGSMKTEEWEVKGYFHKNLLIGSVFRYSKNKTELFYCKQGVIHGFYLSLRRDHSLELFGMYLNGSPVGHFWRQESGGNYTFGTLNNQSVFHGLDVCFIFPDFSTVMRGQFEDGRMVTATLGAMVGVEVKSGILHPVLEASGSNQEYSLEKETRGTICENPLLPDPYERKTVLVGQSKIDGAGEGLFAKVRIAKGQIAAFFNGIKVQKTSDSDYCIALKDEERHMLDIPEKCRSTHAYQATLGHKICHSFTPNAAYDHVFHPRFGQIRCARAIKAIEPGEEVTCDYKYSLGKNVPDWYLKSLNCHLSAAGLNADQINKVLTSLK